MSSLSAKRRRWLLAVPMGLLMVIVGTVAAASDGPGGKKDQIVVTARQPAGANNQDKTMPSTALSTPATDANAPLALRRPATAGAPPATTTVPRAPAAHLSPPTTANATVPPAAATSPTTRATTAATKPATTGTPSPAMVTMANYFPSAVSIGLGGRTYQLAAGQTLGPVAVTPDASGNDIVSVRDLASPGCGMGDAQTYFYADRTFTINVNTGPDKCLGIYGPAFQVLSGIPHTG